MMATTRARGAPSALQQVHVAVLGMNGVGKSALTVKYMTRRFITEYDANLGACRAIHARP